MKLTITNLGKQYRRAFWGLQEISLDVQPGILGLLGPNGAMKAFGFTNSDIRAQYVARSVFVLIVGVLLCTFLANTFGEALVGAVIASLGAASFKFVVNPLTAYLLSPLLMMGTVLAATFLGTQNAGQIEISENIKE